MSVSKMEKVVDSHSEVETNSQEEVSSYKTLGDVRNDFEVFSRIDVFDKYKPIEYISAGTYGQVVKSVERNPVNNSNENDSNTPLDNDGNKTPKYYAIKVIKIENENDGITAATAREATALRSVKHPNIVRLHGLYYSMGKGCGIPEIMISDPSNTHQSDNVASNSKNTGRIAFVMDYYEKDLRKFIESLHVTLNTERRRHRGEIRIPTKQAIDSRLIRGIMFQIIAACGYLHKRGIIIRDVKSGNILIDTKSYKVVLCDFGLARLYGSSFSITSQTLQAVTMWYRCPQLTALNFDGVEPTIDPYTCFAKQNASKQDEKKRKGALYGSAIDVWGIGCVFLELFYGWPVFKCNTDAEQIDAISMIMGTPTEKEWPMITRIKEAGIKVKKYDGISLSCIPGITPVAEDLIKKMLAWDPANRITCAEALCHEYFTGPDSDMLLPPGYDIYEATAWMKKDSPQDN